MENFYNILYVSDGIGDETAALKQAFSVARNNKAAVTGIVVCPPVPQSFGDYEDKYYEGVMAQLLQSAESARQDLNISEDDLPFFISVESGSTPAIRVINQVLQQNYDLVIKEAGFKDGGTGFKAMDMDLLRKCPCPVWLSRPIERHHQDIRIAVAIDPSDEDQVGQDLAIKLLKEARALADTCNGTLHVFSCWVYPFEDYLRNNPRSSIAEPEIQKLIRSEKADHKLLLEALIAKSRITGDIKIYHEKGVPEQVIPQMVEGGDIDILVMGTVARVGVQAFFMGNTAENIVQNLKCSLVAFKPNGFVSPVKAS